jgi:hypothetical protein
VRLAHGADESGGDPLGDQPDAFAGIALVAHLGDHLVLAGGLGEAARLEDGMGDRLLDVHVLAGPHAVHRDVRMGVVGRRHDDAVDLRMRLEHLAVVGVGLRLGEELDGVGATAEIQIAQGDDVLLGALADVAATDASEADHRHVHLLVRRDGASGGLHPGAGGGEAGGGEAGSLQEAATICGGIHGVVAP